MTDVQIFQILAIVYTAVGLGMLINTEFYKKLYADFAENAMGMYFGGLMAIIVGFLLVTFHNTWTKDFAVIITVLGWIALVKGIVIFICPKAMIAITKAMSKKNLKIMAIFVIIFGLALAFLGFCPKSPLINTL